jgi:hypothetical protein
MVTRELLVPTSRRGTLNLSEPSDDRDDPRESTDRRPTLPPYGAAARQHYRRLPPDYRTVNEPVIPTDWWGSQWYR